MKQSTTRTRTRTRIGRGAALTGAIALAVGAFAGTASAHVTIGALGEVAPGEFAKIAFAVPNEQDQSSTTKVEVQMPKDQSLPFVSVAPKPGWTVATTTRKLDKPITMEGATIDTVVDTVTWTATDGGGIGAGQFDQFWVSVGPIPEGVDHLDFPAVQTYANGDVVRWIEPTPAGGAEPEHPMPTLGIGAATGDGHGMGGDTETTLAAGSSDSHDSGGTSTLSVIALVVGALGLAAGGAALATTRRRPAA